LRWCRKVEQEVVSVPNERLRRAISDSGLRLHEVAAEVGIDVKTAERWITKGRVPHPGNRASIARLLSVDEAVLWPQLADAAAQAASDAELLRVYPHRGAVPAGCWYELIGSAHEHVDVLVYSGLFLLDGRADLPGLLRSKASEGVHVRLLYGDPDSDAVALRGSEEGIGDGLAARIRLSLSYIEPALEAPNVRVRLHDTTLYNSIYRYDDEMLVNTHAYGVGAAHSPVLHLRRTPSGRLFEQYMASFERVWDCARTADCDAASHAMFA
jgi:transcriptional regulator with XRE-family HTH domain